MCHVHITRTFGVYVHILFLAFVSLSVESVRWLCSTYILYLASILPLSKGTWLEDRRTIIVYALMLSPGSPALSFVHLFDHECHKGPAKVNETPNLRTNLKTKISYEKAVFMKKVKC